MLCKHTPHLVLEDMRRVDLRREKVEGERGEDGLEERSWKNLGLFLAVLNWSFGVSGGCNGGVDGVVAALVMGVVRHRSLGLETG